MRLILFSGGVESTALLTLADKEDILLLSELPFRKYENGYDIKKCQAIADHFGNPLITYKSEMPDDGNKWQHQIHWLMFAAHLYANSRDDIKEVWYGLSKEDAFGFSAEKRAIYKNHEDAWNLLNPKIKFFKPLEFLKKKQQWNLIPDEIKPFVVSCIYNNDCGTCYKCKERIKCGIGVENERDV